MLEKQSSHLRTFSPKRNQWLINHKWSEHLQRRPVLLTWAPSPCRSPPDVHLRHHAHPGRKEGTGRLVSRAITRLKLSLTPHGFSGETTQKTSYFSLISHEHVTKPHSARAPRTDSSWKRLHLGWKKGRRVIHRRSPYTVYFFSSWTLLPCGSFFLKKKKNFDFWFDFVVYKWHCIKSYKEKKENQ